MSNATPRACAKCGSTDLHIEHAMALSFHRESYMEDNRRKISKFINTRDCGFECSRECLLITCRVCQFKWEESPLDKRKPKKGTP